MTGRKKCKDGLTEKDEDAPAQASDQAAAPAADAPEEAPVDEEPVSASEPPGMAELRRQLAQKDELARAYFAQLQRVQADFENFQKRVEAERARIADGACEAMIAGLLDTLDNFERAIGHLETLPDDSARGVTMVYEAMLAYLREKGLERIAAAGCQFDPRRHEAVMQAEDAGSPDGTVLEEFQAGYSVKGRVVRPTKVKVSRRPPEKESNEVSEDDKEE